MNNNKLIRLMKILKGALLMIEQLKLDTQLNILKTTDPDYFLKFEIREDLSVILSKRAESSFKIKTMNEEERNNKINIQHAVKISDGEDSHNEVSQIEEIGFIIEPKGKIKEATISAHYFGIAFSKETLKISDLKNKLVKIIEFLNPVIQQKEFTIEFNKFFTKKMIEKANCFITEEYELKDFDVETIKQFALIYFSCFPVYAKFAEKTSYSLFDDGFYGFINPANYIYYQSCVNYQDFIKEVFGTYRKDLARLAKYGNNSVFCLMHKFIGIVTPDFMSEVLDKYSQTKNQLQIMEFDMINMDFSNLLKIPMKVRQNLFSQLILDDMCMVEDYLIKDTLDMIDELTEKGKKNIKGKKTWEELHDHVMINSIVSRNHNVINIPEKIEQLSQKIMKGFVFEPLTLSQQFYEIGAELRNCLKSSNFFKKSIRGESYCMVIKDSATKSNIGAVELRQSKYEDCQWSVIQLNGYNNNQFDGKQEIEEEIEEFMNNNDDRMVSHV